MPFKLRLKKSRQYNVVSKSLFVICIELLDSSSTECTLTSESTGRECLENVCQRLGLQQTEFFGLRYVSKTGAPRWIELERPLKRQLDKYAKDNSLYLRVMYYVSGIGLIQDEMTRYHYFLQLKNDIIEGRIQCNVDDSIILASYCMQAEFGNYNIERHTPEYLKDFALFPKDLVENGLLERLTDAVIQQHSALVGLSQGTAEEYYILAAQQLDGYGQETFLVKDEHGLETVLGVTLKGIIVNGENVTKFYKWSEIVNVINHKKNFGIETQNNESIVNFVFPDVESAKYVWRMCVHQHTFYMQYEVSEEETDGGEPPVSKSSSSRAGGRGLFQNIDTALLSSREELDDIVPTASAVSLKNINMNIATSREELNERTQSNLDLVENQDIDKLRSLLPSYRPAPDYETAIQQKYKTEHSLYSSQPEIHSFPDVTQHYNQRNALHTYSTPDLEKQMYMLHVFKSPPPYPISNSTPDLASQSTPDLAVTNTSHNIHINNTHNFINTQVSGSSPDLVSSRSLSQQYNIHQHYPETHRTYANLANILQQQQHAFEDKAMMYHYLNNNNSEASNMLIQYLKNKSNLDATNRLVANRIATNPNPGGTLNAHEPIYENVPLPWQQTASSNEQTVPPIQPNSKQPVHRTNSIEAQQQIQLQAQNSRKSSTNSNKLIEDLVRTSDGRKSGGKIVVEVNKEIISPKNNMPQIVQSSQNVTNINVGAMKLIDNEQSISKTKLHASSSVPGTRTVPSLPIENKTKNMLGNDITSISIAGTSSSSRPVIDDVNSIVSLNTSKNSDTVDSGRQNRNHYNFTKSEQINSSQTSSNKVNSLLFGDTSNVSCDSTSSSTNTNTVDKKKKKWGGFLSGGGSGSSSKSKTATLPRFDDKKAKSTVISKEAMCQILESKLSDQQLFFEFEKIPKVPKVNPDFTSAQVPDNMVRNRFKDVLPYEENRVRLSAKRDNKLGYINASHITATVGNEQRFYIAAQSPLPNTVENFWEMIWETNVYLVINLSELHSDTNVQYIPDKATKIIDVGEFRITKELTQETGHCITCKLKLTHAVSKRMRSVWHLQYTNWNVSNNTPNSVSHFLGFLEEISSIREHIVTEMPPGHNKNPPILVHCVCGVEKTGVAILCDLLLYMLDHNEEVDMPRILLSLRNQRMKVVANVVQYTFVHNVLVYYLKHSRLI